MPTIAFEGLFPKTDYPLLRLLVLFIDLYEALEIRTRVPDSGPFYQHWFELWWDVWCQRHFGPREHYAVAFYNARWWCYGADDERKRMCDMLEGYIARAKAGEGDLSMLRDPSGCCKDPFDAVSAEEEKDFKEIYKKWRDRRQNTVVKRKARGQEAPTWEYDIPVIAHCAERRHQHLSLIQAFEPWNSNGIESGVTYAGQTHSDPRPPASHPPTATHTHSEASAHPPMFLEPPVQSRASGPPASFFRSLAHRQLHPVLNQFSHRQRAIYRLD